MELRWLGFHSWKGDFFPNPINLMGLGLRVILWARFLPPGVSHNHPVLCTIAHHHGAIVQVGMRATIEQLVSYKQRFPVPKFELPENIYTDDFDVTEAEKVKSHPPLSDAPLEALTLQCAGN